MARSGWWAGAFVAVLTFSSWAEAQCTKDTDCKGDRVCDAGACKSAAALSPEDPNGWGVGATAVSDEAETPATAAAPPAASPADASVPAPAPAVKPDGALDTREPKGDAAEQPLPPKPKRHSTGMMAAGIVMVSVSPLPLLGALVMGAKSSACSAYDDGVLDHERDCDRDRGAAVALTLTGLALIGVGVPLIVIGGKRVPAKEPRQAQVVPYAFPGGAGLRLRLQL